MKHPNHSGNDRLGPALEKALADAICHQVAIKQTDAEAINLDLIECESNKRVISSFKSLYTHPDRQPTIKQIADDVHISMIDAGYSNNDAESVADAIEELRGRRKQPDVKIVSNALTYFSLPPIHKEHNLFKLINGFEGYDKEFSYLIKGYLPMNSLGMIYGSSGSFKSFHALNWAAHVAMGKSWNGQRVNKSAVLYVAGEGGIGVPRRIKALADKYNSGKPISNLYRLDHPIAMNDITEVNQLADTIEHFSNKIGKKFSLVIIDTLARCFGTGDENKTNDMNRFVAACDRLKAQLALTVLVVHHSGVADRERARGSSALRAACDFEFRVERAKRDTPAIALTSTKAKDDKEKPKQIFQLSNVSLFIDSDGDEVESLVASDIGEEPPAENEKLIETQLSVNEQMIYQIVRARQEVGNATTKADVRDVLKTQGTNLKHFSRWLKGCIEKGALACNDEVVTTVVA